jgi:hypothetical protein
VPIATVQRSLPVTQRTPLMSPIAISSVSTQNSVTISAAQPHLMLNIPTPPVSAPAPARPANFRHMITGSDVMLYDGQNYVPRFMRGSSSSSAAAVAASTANEPVAPTVVPEVVSECRNPSPMNSIPNWQAATTRSNPLSGYYRPPSPLYHHAHHHHQQPPQQASNPTELVAPPAHQNCRQHVGRCPFMTEGHHYNRPRRLPRDFYTMPNGRPPYAVHEDLYRRQYQEQENRRHYWASSLNNDSSNEAPTGLRPPQISQMPPSLEPIVHHRLLTSLGDPHTNGSINHAVDSPGLRSWDRPRYQRMW